MKEQQNVTDHQLLNELAADAKTPEDLAQLAEWRNELTNERQEAVRNLGRAPIELAQLPDGSVVTKTEAVDLMQDGHQSHAYGKGARRA